MDLTEDEIDLIVSIRNYKKLTQGQEGFCTTFIELLV